MDFKPLEIEGAWLAESTIHSDKRGKFQEWYKPNEFKDQIGKTFLAKQANSSISSRGTIRGIHFSTSILGQAKWVSCSAGAILDVVVDVRPKSPTFKKWIAIELQSFSGRSIIISEGLGHAFLSVAENSVVNYILTSEYSPEREEIINPFDKEIGINWPEMDYKLSDRDFNSRQLSEYFSENKDLYF